MDQTSGTPDELVTAMCALVIRATANDALIPEFEQTGFRASIVWDPTVALMKRIEAGQHADVLLAIDWALDELASRKMIETAARVPVVQSSVGIAVTKGLPKPDISSAARLTEALLNVDSLAYSRAGASGIYFEKLIDKLGIGDEIRAKATVIPAGLTGEKIASGEVVMAIQQVSELMAVDGIDLVGPMPEEVQATTRFSACVFSGANHPEGAARFVDTLRSPRMRQAYVRFGLDPLFDG